MAGEWRKRRKGESKKRPSKNGKKGVRGIVVH